MIISCAHKIFSINYNNVRKIWILFFGTFGPPYILQLNSILILLDLASFCIWCLNSDPVPDLTQITSKRSNINFKRMMLKTKRSPQTAAACYRRYGRSKGTTIFSKSFEWWWLFFYTPDIYQFSVLINSTLWGFCRTISLHFSLDHNMQYSLFCQPGVRDGRAHVFPQVHRPPQDRCFWMGRVSLVVVLRTGRKQSSYGALVGQTKISVLSSLLLQTV